MAAVTVASNVTEGFHPPASLGSLVGPAQELRHGLGNAATGGVWRVRGAQRSAVLKIARPPHPDRAHMAWRTSNEPSHWNFWRREVRAYETGLAATAYRDAGIAAPDVLGVVERVDGGVELWLEEVAGPAGFEWGVPRLARFAYELGVAQARWIGRVPEDAWLSRGWLAQYLGEGPSRSVRLPLGAWESALVSAAWPTPVRGGLRRVWAERSRVLALAESLGGTEGTLCHLDVWPANLIDANGTSTLLDWSFVGRGAVGEDVANLILDSCSDGLMDIALLPEITDSCVVSYISGLRDGGWGGQPDQVRRAIAVCGAAKYCWLGPAIVAGAVRGENERTSYGQDDSAAAALHRLTDLVTLIVQWADMALA